jgi:hypothetical protein
MYMLARKLLDTGDVTIFTDPDWALLKRRITRLEIASWDKWDRLRVWDLLRNEGAVIHEGSPYNAVWQYVDLNEIEMVGIDNSLVLFNGVLMHLAHMQET